MWTHSPYTPTGQLTYVNAGPNGTGIQHAICHTNGGGGIPDYLLARQWLKRCTHARGEPGVLQLALSLSVSYKVLRATENKLTL